jgi:hypothetical protein
VHLDEKKLIAYSGLETLGVSYDERSFEEQWRITFFY